MNGKLDFYGVIYKIRNKINNKIYIGQTTRINGFSGRYWAKGEGVERVYNYYKNRKDYGHQYNEHLLSSINKYGLDSFEVDECFDIAMSQNELNKLENMYIKIYETTNSKYGYNHREGGNSSGKHANNSKTKDGIHIRCLNDGYRFKSIREASRFYTVSENYIRKMLKMKHIPEIYLRFSYIKKSESKYFCKFCGKEGSEEMLSESGYCKKCNNKTSRLNMIRKNIDINGYIKNISKLYKFNEVEINISFLENNVIKNDITNCNNKIIIEKSNIVNKTNNTSEYKMNLERKKILKEEFEKENSEKIVYLYNKYKSIKSVAACFDVEFINYNDIRNIITKNNTKLIDPKYNEEYKSYILVKKCDEIIKGFEYNHECRAWIVSIGLCNTERVARNYIESSNRHDKQYFGYTFKKVSKEEYFRIFKN